MAARRRRANHPGRKDDDDVLHWLQLRVDGFTCGEIATMPNTPSELAIRVMTGKVRKLCDAVANKAKKPQNQDVKGWW